MTIPAILALDFDGVLCDGMREYFEASRRTCLRVWPDEAAPDEERFSSFRALVRGWSESAILRNWEGVRDEVVGSGRLRGEELVGVLKRTLDDVRREWIAAARD